MCNTYWSVSSIAVIPVKQFVEKPNKLIKALDPFPSYCLFKQFLDLEKFSRDLRQFDKYPLRRIDSQNSLRRRSLTSMAW